MPRLLNKNWITAYAEAIAPVTEAPEAFVIWSAISVISSVLKKKVWIKRGTYKVYPNQYIVLVGPPGVGKGTAIHPAHSFLKESKPPLTNYISDRVTAPKIIEKLHTGFATVAASGGTIVQGMESSCTLMSTELPTLLTSSDWMLQFLCDAWDRNEFEYDTRNKGTFIIKDMCVSLIGACVPEYIRRLNKDATSAISGGFTARTIFVFAGNKSKSLAWPTALEDSAKGLELKNKLTQDIKAIARLNGEFTFTQDAAYRWEMFYNTIKQSDDDSDVVMAFKARQGVHVMKVAMCLSAAGSDSLTIGLWELQTAIGLVASVLSTLDVTFRGVGESPLAEATARIQSIIEKKGIISRGELLKMTHRHVTPEDLDRIMRVLESIDFCKSYTQQGRLYYEHKNPALKTKIKPKGININVGTRAANGVNP